MNNQLHSQDWSSFLSRLPTEPGVYQMLDREGQVLYVGKASNLKKRVSSYFVKTTHAPKTRTLVRQINSIEVSVTRSETEALLLESNLIKRLRPKYNVLLRDDKSYPYLHVSSHAKFSRITLVRCRKKPKQGQFFGPYPSIAAVRETLGVIQKVFKIRNCSDSYFNSRSRPCLQYQIKRCSAPCTALISERAYQQSVRDAIQFLQGKSQHVLTELATRMEEAVARLAFEEAARLRDQIKQLRLIQEQQGMINQQGDADVIAIEARPGFACIQWVTIREGQVLGSQSFFPDVPQQVFEEEDEKQLWQHVFSAFIAYFYLETPERIPALILTHQELEDADTLQCLLTQLRGKPCHIQINPRGKKARWIDFAQNNLRLSVEEHQGTQQIIQQRYEALQHWLKLPQRISRMECFDISHTQGDSTVASCVVFDVKGPCKRAYRTFNITGITPGDDYAAMEQALMRRFKPGVSKQQLPDVLIIDGGKGQVAIARKVIEFLSIEGVCVLGVAKGPTRKAGFEQLILAHGPCETALPPDSPAWHVLQHIRDEAHRFAITHHRKKRQGKSLHSSLEGIEGIGPARRRALLQRFGGMRELVKASVEELAKVPGISMALALRIYEHFRV